MLKTILLIIVIVLVVAVVGVVALAAAKPDSFRVQRSTSIKAAPDKIFALINDFKAWPKWSPYENRDPNMQRTLSGADAGPGAVYEWKGDKNVGQGRMEILESTAPTKITIKLDFLTPFEAHNTATFTMVPQGDATEVTWAMDGPSPFITKVMGVFMNFDKLIGTDFETGLANLKRLTEAN
jgi:carbon monoxide dehydrogenase subunit G